MKEFITWVITIWPILALIGAIAMAVSGWVIKHDFGSIKQQKQVNQEASESVEAEPEISIQIDNCSWRNPEIIKNEIVLIIEVALTLYVKNPPVNVTDLQLYIEDGKQKLLDSNPPIPFTQENTKGCYIARFGFSLSSPNFVISNEVKKYQLRVMAMGKMWTSGESSPKIFTRLLAVD